VSVASVFRFPVFRFPVIRFPVFGFLLLISMSSVFAQDYPVRDIRAISPVAAGSGGDILVRYYADKLSRLAGKPVVVENRGGAQGVVGTEAAARAKPDGYTLLFTPASSMLAAQPHFFKKLPFDPFKDFASVVPLAWLPFGIVVDAKSPIRTMADLSAHLRTRKGDGFYGAGNNSGIGTAELYKEMAGLKTTHVPYKSAPQGLAGLLEGQIDFLVWDSTFLSGHVRAGRVRMLAVTSAKRSDSLPDVPTMQESGFPGYEISSWWGLAVPAGTPRPIIDKLAGWMNEISSTEETRQFLAKVATGVMTGTPELMASMLKTEYERWGRLVKLAKIEPE
jgi:tripartite-type tricarboxylate transporter receptor subunit TctC